MNSFKLLIFEFLLFYALGIKIMEDLQFVENPSLNYPQIRIHLDYTNVEDGSFKDYLRVHLMPAAVDYLQGALRVKRPLKEAMQFPANYKFCGTPSTPELYTNGIKSDYTLIVTTCSLKNTSFAAETFTCYRAPSGRPVVGKMNFNLDNMPHQQLSSVTQERNIVLVLHEIIHALGFSVPSFLNFRDEFGNPRKNHWRTLDSDGPERKILDVEPLTQRLRDHFQCPSIPGALMEDDGGSGTKNHHFERRIFLYEIMTSGIMNGMRISEFTLAILEGSGWYIPDYNFAEPFYFGKGKGCDFYYGFNIQNSTYGYGYCSSLSTRGCSPTGRAGGKCFNDATSGGHYYHRPHNDFDCENPNAEINARLKGMELFGKGKNSKCFGGTLEKEYKTGEQTSFCFQYDCKYEGLDTVVEVLVGNQKVVCREEGAVKVQGFTGELFCPDPIPYCSTLGKRFCPRGCMGRGDCKNGKCVCRPGYTGFDCTLFQDNFLELPW